MAKVAAFYSSDPKAKVYHDISSCTKGNKIEKKYLKSGKGGRPKCKECKNAFSMGKVAAFYSSHPSGRVYHDNFRCPEGNNIEKKYIEVGKERPKCKKCKKLNENKVKPFHSSDPKAKVYHYHDSSSCTKGKKIKEKYLKLGKERTKCEHCKDLNKIKVTAFHSRHSWSKVYHNNPNCTEGHNIETEYIKPGRGRPKCKKCKKLKKNKVKPFYYLDPKAEVYHYHDSSSCKKDKKIKKEYRKLGKERTLCKNCIKLNKAG